MGGWSGGVYSRFRNWVTDKANSINPQAALFDQEDDGFAAGLNNCITKDGLSKPTSAMDWNGQSLTGVLNLANTGTVSLVGGKVTVSLNGNVVSTATAGDVLTLNGVSGGNILNLNVASGQFTLQSWSHASVAKGQVYWDDSAGTFNVSALGIVPLNLLTNGAVRVTVSGAGTLQAVDDGGTLQTVGWRDVPQNVQTGNYTAVLADRGKSIFMNGTGLTFTIPSNASVAYPIGTVLTIIVTTPATLTIAINSDNLFLAGSGTTGSRTLINSGIATAVKVLATSWFISGAGLS
jgi:hypothetical protein